MITLHRLGRYGRRDSPLIRRALPCIIMAKNTIATMTAESTRHHSAPCWSIQTRKHPIHYLHRSALDYNDDIFNFTRGRFVRNEAHEMSQRHIHFNINELAHVAAVAVGAKSCVSIKKYPDGSIIKPCF